MVNHYAFNHVQISTFQRAKAGNKKCGDSYLVLETKDYFVCGIADGLGSGDPANESAEMAVSILKRHHHLDVDKMMDEVNIGLRGKRGAVLAVFKLNYLTNEMYYCSVGNINIVVYSNNEPLARPLPHGGYLSGKPQTYRVEKIPIKGSSYFHMYSDGFNLSLQEADRIFKMTHPQRAAACLKEVVTSISDDITYIVGKITITST